VIFESMKWCGLDWDEGPSEHGDVGGYGPYTQTSRFMVYTQIADQLIAALQLHQVPVEQYVHATVQHILATWGEPPPGFEQRPRELAL
jgi:hypothetical protein